MLPEKGRLLSIKKGGVGVTTPVLIMTAGSIDDKGHGFELVLMIT